MLGDQCPFDHGIDPVVIGNNIPHTYPPPPSMVGIPSLTLTKPGHMTSHAHAYTSCNNSILFAGFLVPAGKVSPTGKTSLQYLFLVTTCTNRVL